MYTFRRIFSKKAPLTTRNGAFFLSLIWTELLTYSNFPV
jgi:hypothetical protein